MAAAPCRQQAVQPNSLAATAVPSTKEGNICDAGGLAKTQQHVMIIAQQSALTQMHPEKSLQHPHPASQMTAKDTKQQLGNITVQRKQPPVPKKEI